MKAALKIFLLIIALMDLASSQSITNTLGNAGLFKIKDGVNTYFTLTQSSGYIDLTKSLRLVNTTDLNTGVIYKGTDRFIHNYKPLNNGGENTFVGINSGNFFMGGAGYWDGSSNSAFGFNTLTKNTSGTSNSAFGNSTLYNNTFGDYNTAIGSQALYTNIGGSNNTSIGFESLFSNTGGNNNTAIGYDALYNNTSGASNTAVGLNSLFTNTTGIQNTAIGQNALYTSTVGGNTAVGFGSLNGTTTGSYNTAIGLFSGTNVTTGYNLTLIGYGAEPSVGGTSNQITLGNFQITSLRCNVQNITSLSDARDKKNIQDLSLGLDFISKLKPRQFNWDKRDWYDNKISDGSKMDTNFTAGFIAQELDVAQKSQNAAWLNLVLKENPEKWEATYGNLLPVMVKAIQELKVENDKLKKEIESFKSVQDRVTMLELTILKDAAIKQIKSAQK